MQIGGVEVYVNHGVLPMGSTGWPPTTLEMGADPLAVCDTHVAVKVRAQDGVIRVRLFNEWQEGSQPDPSFVTVFDGTLLLLDGRFAIGDVEGFTRYVRLVGDRGEWGVRVAVDRPGSEARAIDVKLMPPR